MPRVCKGENPFVNLRHPLDPQTADYCFRILKNSGRMGRGVGRVDSTIGPFPDRESAIAFTWLVGDLVSRELAARHRHQDVLPLLPRAIRDRYDDNLYRARRETAFRRVALEAG